MNTQKLFFKTFIALIAMSFMILWVATPSMAQEKKSATQSGAKMMEKSEMNMNRYLVMIDNPNGDCETSMQSMMIEMKGTDHGTQGTDNKETSSKDKSMSMREWGCSPDNHTSYIVTMAANETEALSMLPESMRANAKAIKLSWVEGSKMKSMDHSMEMKKEGTDMKEKTMQGTKKY